MTEFYWTDGQLNRWSTEDGVSSVDLSEGLFGAAFSCPDGEGGIVVVGYTEFGLGYESWGWRTDLALNVTNPDWGAPDDTGIQEWTMDNGDTTNDAGFQATRGAGVFRDPVSGDVLVSAQSVERSDGPPTYNFLEEDVVVRFTLDGDMRSTHLASQDGIGGPYMGPAGNEEHGGFAFNPTTRKAYYLSGSIGEGLVEWDIDDNTYRFSEDCFVFDSEYRGHLQVHPSTGDLWVMESTPVLSATVRIHRFGVETIPWGLSSVQPVPDDSFLVFDEDDEVALSFGQNFAFMFDGDDAIIFQAFDYDSGNAAWFRKALGEAGPPELLVNLGDDWFGAHSNAWDVWKLEDPPVPDIRTSTNPARLRWAAPH